jgi:hypothetical protein
MSVRKWIGYGGFVSQKDLNQVSREGGLKIVGKKRWVVLQPSAGAVEFKGACRAVVIATAGALELELEEFEEAIIRDVVKRKRVGGIECTDCVLIHPAAYGRAVSGLLKGWGRKKKGEGTGEIPSPAKRNRRNKG